MSFAHSLLTRRAPKRLACRYLAISLTTALIEERVHLALDNNNAAFARQIIEQLPPERAAPLFQWAGLLESPLRNIDALIASPSTPVNEPALLAGWKPQNVIWEVALREGLSLNTRFAPRDLANGNKIYDVMDPDTGQKFMICLDDKILADLSKHCELTLEDLFVCRDVALDDSAAANLALQCRLKTI